MNKFQKSGVKFLKFYIIISIFALETSSIVWQRKKIARLTPDMHLKIASLAKKTGISINALIKKAVKNQIAAML